MAEIEDTRNPSARQALLWLADRCEREEASRELDARIEQAIAPDKIVLFDAGSVGPVKRDAVRGPLRNFPMEGWEGKWAWEAVAREVMSRFYTSSLDAAVTLLAVDDVFWRVGHDGNGPNPADFKAEVLHAMVGRKAEGTAATPALALCAAALRARAQEAE